MDVSCTLKTDPEKWLKTTAVKHTANWNGEGFLEAPLF